MEMKKNRKKGQFFLLSAIIVATLFYIGFYITHAGPLISVSTETEDMKYVLYNLQNEYPRVFNDAASESNESGRLSDFTLFSRSAVSEKIINYTALWLYTKNTTSGINITIGNFLEGDVIVSINISGTAKNVSVPYEGTNSTIFSSVGQFFNMTINFNSREKKLSMTREKRNLYAYLRLSRVN